MITFETQEEFENAVMQVLKGRLTMELWHKGSSDKLSCSLSDGDTEIASDIVYLS